jgi:hypothetical protein
MLADRCRRWLLRATAAAPGFFLGRRDPGVTLATPHNVQSSGERLALKCKRSRRGRHKRAAPDRVLGLQLGVENPSRIKSQRVCQQLVREFVPACRRSGGRRAAGPRSRTRAPGGCRCTDRRRCRCHADASVEPCTRAEPSSASRRPAPICSLEIGTITFRHPGEGPTGQLLHVEWGACCMRCSYAKQGALERA